MLEIGWPHHDDDDDETNSFIQEDERQISTSDYVVMRERERERLNDWKLQLPPPSSPGRIQRDAKGGGGKK